MRHRLEEEKRALLSFVTDIDLHLRERSSFIPRLSAMPSLPGSTPRSSLSSSKSGPGHESATGAGVGAGKPRRSLGAVLIESNNNTRIMSGLGDVKEELEEKNGQKQATREDDKENMNIGLPSVLPASSAATV